MMGTGDLNVYSFFAVINDLADRKQYWNSLWYLGIYGAKSPEISFCHLNENSVLLMHGIAYSICVQ